MDTIRSNAFEFLHTSEHLECAVSVLHSEVLPSPATEDAAVQAVLIKNGTEFCDRIFQPYQLYLTLNDIDIDARRSDRPKRTDLLNGSLERSWTSSSALRSGRRSTNPSIHCEKTAIDGKNYNTNRTLHGYRNFTADRVKPSFST